MRSDLGWSLTFDEVPPVFRVHVIIRAIFTARTTNVRHENGVDLKRVPPKSRRPPPVSRKIPEGTLSIEEPARKDSAVHVSLSSDSPVKQPGTMAVPPSVAGRPSKLKPPTAIGSHFTEYQ